MTKSLSSIWLLGWVLVGLSNPPVGSGPAMVSSGVVNDRTYNSLGECERAARAEVDAARVGEVKPVSSGSAQNNRDDFFADAVPIYPDGYVCVPAKETGQ